MPEQPPTLTPLPSWSRDQRKTDADHVKLLAVFHFVGAGLAVAGMLFLLVHFIVMRTFFLNPQFWQGQKTPPPPIVFELLKWGYALGALWLLVSFTLNLISGFCLIARKGRTFSLIVACFNCLHVPLGTVLGAFTITVLLRDSVREWYADKN